MKVWFSSSLTYGNIKVSLKAFNSGAWWLPLAAIPGAVLWVAQRAGEYNPDATQFIHCETWGGAVPNENTTWIRMEHLNSEGWQESIINAVLGDEVDYVKPKERQDDAGQ